MKDEESTNPENERLLQQNEIFGKLIPSGKLLPYYYKALDQSEWDKGAHMEKLIVLREKAFAGALLPYWIIIGFSKIIFMQKHNFGEALCEISVEGNSIPRITVEELDRIGISINNGQTKMISAADDVNHLFISTMGGRLLNEIDVDDCMKNHERRITINTEDGFKSLFYPVVMC